MSWEGPQPASPGPALDAGFLAPPLDRLADAALARASALGAVHADFRLAQGQTESVERVVGQLHLEELQHRTPGKKSG